MGSFEKVAGEMAWYNTTQGTQKVFYTIGLTIDLHQKQCKPYKLQLDFLKSNSALYCGDEYVNINEGINRLFLTLQNNA